MRSVPYRLMMARLRHWLVAHRARLRSGVLASIAHLHRWVITNLSLRLPATRGLGVGEVGWRAVKDFFVDDMTTYAAALAFHLFLALFPFVIFLIALLAFLHIPGFFDWLLAQARIVAPVGTMGQVSQALRQVRAHAHGGLLSVGIIGAVWASSNGMRSLMNALNVAYDATESRSIWQRYLLSIAFTIGFALLIIAATALMVTGPEATTWLADRVGLGQVAIALWTWLRVPIALLLLMCAVALLYDVVPNVDQPFELLTPGAVLAVAVWLAASLGFSAYVMTFSHYTATYGNIAAIVVLLLYFFVSSLALLLGAEVNGVIYQHAPRYKKRASREKPTPKRAGTPGWHGK